MHSFLLCLLCAVLLVGVLLFALIKVRQSPSRFSLCNIGSGTHENAKSYFSDEALAVRYLLVTIGSDSEHIALCAADDIPIGTVPDEVATADIAAVPVGVELLGICNKTMLMVPSENITAGEEVFAAAGGKIQDLPVGAGTYYSVGYALEDGSLDVPCEVLHHSPRAVIVT